MHTTLLPETFGAKADGKTLNTRALQASIDACHAAGGGVVACGAGVYRTGSIELKSHVELHLGQGCQLLGSTNLDDYQDLVSEGFHHEIANERSARYLIGARHAHDIAITGPGEINGSGPAFYDQTEPLNAAGRFATKPYPRPRIVMFHECTDIRFSDSRYVDSPCWTFWLIGCERIRIKGLTILGDKRLLNNDGIDFDACRDVVLSDCIIHTEDDCLVVRAIQKVHDKPAISENIVITNCVLESTHQCIRISCPNDHITRNCLFSNLTLKSSRGIYIDLPTRFLSKNGKGSHAQVSDMRFSNLRIDTRSCPLRVAVEEGVHGTRIQGIHFNDLQITAGASCIVQGNRETLIEDIHFSNVRLAVQGEKPPILCSNCRNVTFNNVEFAHSL